MSSQLPQAEHTFGTLNEKPLHAALKAWYAQPGDQFEVRVAGFIVDIVRGDLLIEIQTGNFSSIKGKLAALTAQQPVRLVYPIARDKWIIKLAEDKASHQNRRRSPRRGMVEDLFAELVSLPNLLAHPNFSLDVLLVQEEEVRRYDGTRRWRRWRRGGWVTHERRLLQVVDQHLFQTPADAARLLPPALADPFTTSELAAALGRSRRLAQRMAYCLREMGMLEVVGKRSNALLYSRTAV